MSDPKLHPPFSNGSQFCDWECRNCFRGKGCANYDPNDSETCPISETVLAVLAEHRPWTKEDDKAIGYDRSASPYTWPCPSYREVGTPEPFVDCENQLELGGIG